MSNERNRIHPNQFKPPVSLPEDLHFCYTCCGNCRYYDDGWCGYLRTTTSGSDSPCSNWTD